jgi:glycosyltransferase involved in cell wall biosynthesis
MRNGVLICGPWPHPRIAIFSVVEALIAALNRAGHPVLYLSEAFGVRHILGRDAVCLLDIPEDVPFHGRAAFARKSLYPSLTALLAEDCRQRRSRFSRVGILHTHLDQLIFASDHPENSRDYDRVLCDHIAARTGHCPVLVRTRHDDIEGNLDGFMRLTGIDYLALDRAGREAILQGALDLRPLVSDHVQRHRALMKNDWAWDDTFLDEAIHHAWWRLHQLQRWYAEVQHYDAVVCSTQHDVTRNRDLLLGEGKQNLTAIHVAHAFEPKSRRRVDGLLYDFHHHQGLRCRRGTRDDRAPVQFSPEDRKILFVGRPSRIKGCYELAQSLRNLYHGGRRKVRGLFVGEFDPEMRRDLAALDSAHAGDYLLFTGPVYDVDVLAALLAFGDVTAIPSHYEPFCLVALESYRMGTPCVVTEGTGAGDAYLEQPRRHGVVMARPIRRRHADGIAHFYGVDVASLTEQLAFLLDHPLVARRMAEDGERFVRAHYTVERMGDCTLELYDRLRAGEPAHR